MVLGPRLVLSAPSERKSFDNGAVAHRSATAEHGRRPSPEGRRSSAARTGAARTLRVIERWRPCGAGWRSPEVAGHERCGLDGRRPPPSEGGGRRWSRPGCSGTSGQRASFSRRTTERPGVSISAAVRTPAIARSTIRQLSPSGAEEAASSVSVAGRVARALAAGAGVPVAGLTLPVGYSDYGVLSTRTMVKLTVCSSLGSHSMSPSASQTQVFDSSTLSSTRIGSLPT